MPAAPARAFVRANAAALPRAANVERALKRFRPEVSNRVRSMAARHPWIADLAVSFPALLFALAFPRARIGDAGLRAVLAGAPLAKAALAAGVPMWMRAFPPEAFNGAIPDLPDTPDFRRRIANHMPRDWKDAPRWIGSIVSGIEISDVEFAIWLAREATAPKRTRRGYYAKDRSRLIGLWAWFSAHPDTAAGALITTRWNADIIWTNATNAALDWSDAVTKRLWLRERGVEDTWVEPGSADGFDFVPLRTAAELDAESVAMENCVRTYGPDLADNLHRIWSMRRDGVRVATLSLSVAFPDAPFPHISELSMPKNQAAPPDIWLAARKWLHAQDRADADPARLRSCVAGADPATWRAFWKPYWLAKGRIPDWLPLAPREMYTI